MNAIEETVIQGIPRPRHDSVELEGQMVVAQPSVQRSCRRVHRT